MTGAWAPGPAGASAPGAAAALAVDTQELARVRARLEQVAADLAAAGARMAAAEAMALGERRAVTAMERVQQDWGTHVRALRELADVAAHDLGEAAQSYAACEDGAVVRVEAADLAGPGTSVLPVLPLPPLPEISSPSLAGPLPGVLPGVLPGPLPGSPAPTSRPGPT